MTYAFGRQRVLCKDTELEHTLMRRALESWVIMLGDEANNRMNLHQQRQKFRRLTGPLHELWTSATSEESEKGLFRESVLIFWKTR
jgi:hypothetical protein